MTATSFMCWNSWISERASASGGQFVVTASDPYAWNDGAPWLVPSSEGTSGTRERSASRIPPA
ncbi:hypothetical protein O7626_00765 [Micromonospora sp. WMMD1102]|uniref:hypothetical protein n=1 Tax=Micromonospora sp. WMMD1102 TaxID=3016105 RepID=UPI002415707D|nr:hypothetical protein [Micromonospora sp. WMMD1102]MDG4784479.1 hypothetical protein [Micromonospora sp. WMMD1102]